MKTFMNSKYSYLMAAAVLAGSMSFTACTNDEEGVDPINGPKQSVSLGFSVTGLGTKATQDEVNLGTSANLSAINNIIVAPMVNGAYSTVVTFETLDPKTSTKVSKQVSLNTEVNQFRVYGNLPAAKVNPTEGAVFNGFEYTPEKYADADLNEYMKPYELLYFADTKENGFATANLTEGTTWNDAQFTDGKTSLKDVNAVKISGVKYAVGVLALGVRESVNMDKTDPIFFEATDLNEEGTGLKPGVTGKSMNDLQLDKYFEVAGVVVAGQAASFNDAGEWGGRTVKVYEAAAEKAGDLKEGAIATSTEEVTGRVMLDGANVYCVVSPTIADAKVDLNIRFKNVSGKVLALNDGTVVKNGEYFKMFAPLVKGVNSTGNAASIFAPATTTILNAAVLDWGKGSIGDQEATEMELGIEVDMTWAEGLVFDQEI